jgi:hypothetical protein
MYPPNILNFFSLNRSWPRSKEPRKKKKEKKRKRKRKRKRAKEK